MTTRINCAECGHTTETDYHILLGHPAIARAILYNAEYADTLRRHEAEYGHKPHGAIFVDGKKLPSIRKPAEKAALEE